MTATRALLFVQTDVEPEQEAVWNRWYDRRHVPDLLSVPGISSGRRFEAAAGFQGVSVGGALPRYLALYDLDNCSVLASEPYTAMTQRTRHSEEDRPMLRLFRNLNRGVFEELSQAQGEATGPDATVGGQLAVGLVPEPGYEEEYNAWYEEEHLPFLLRVPGVLRARRFRAVEGEPLYLALYDLTAPEVRQSAAFAQAADTPLVCPHARALCAAAHGDVSAGRHVLTPEPGRR